MIILVMTNNILNLNCLDLFFPFIKIVICLKIISSYILFRSDRCQQRELSMVRPRRLSDSSVSSACSADSEHSCLTNVMLQQKRSTQNVKKHIAIFLFSFSEYFVDFRSRMNRDFLSTNTRLHRPAAESRLTTHLAQVIRCLRRESTQIPRIPRKMVGEFVFFKIKFLPNNSF